jgi:CheY-like chemotaxis protein
MSARRALVVDDSRSARAFLTRELERHELAVDGVESAEQAIDYLTHKRPDVIFMDHLMPGMDGFQAVQAIKNNPRTATIPIMMYTSQEGELYLSQARALGAMGVLPKQIKQADVSKALEQLHLLQTTAAVPPVIESINLGAVPAAAAHETTVRERVVLEPTGDMRQERRSSRRPTAPALSDELRSILNAMFEHHDSEMRRFVVDHMETQSDRIVSDMRLLLQDQPPISAAFPPRSRPTNWGSWLALIGVFIAFVFGLQWFKEHGETEQLATQLAQSQQELQSTQQNLTSLQAAEAAMAASSGAPTSDEPGSGEQLDHGSSMEPVPFGEMPLAGARLDRVSALLARLASQGFHGVVQVRSIPGRFCMMSGSNGQPAVAPETTPYSKCEQIGNPREDNGSTSQRESVAFANMVANARQNANAAIDVQISAGSADELLTPYPPITDSLLAGEWNRVAGANNRVEVHWQATHKPPAVTTPASAVPVAPSADKPAP